MAQCFNFSRFKSFAVKHYSEYGRNYMLCFAIIIAIDLLLKVLQNTYIVDADNFEEVQKLIYLCIYIFMTSQCTAWSMGMLDRKNSIIELTLPVSTFERFAFIYLNSFIVGVIIPLVLLAPTDDFISILSVTALLHAITMVIACDGAKRGYSYFVFVFFLCAIGLATFFESIDIFLSYGYGEQISMLPSSQAIYMSNIYETTTNQLTYRWDIWMHIPNVVHIIYNMVVIVLLYIAAYFKLRERRL